MYKSREEEMAASWLEEAKEHGLVESWYYEPEEFTIVPKAVYKEEVALKTKIKTVERVLFQDATYEPDFTLVLSDKGLRAFKDVFTILQGNQVWIEIKGAFNPHQKDGRYDVLRRKILYYLCGVYCQRVEPKKLFACTFCPEEYMWMKNRKEPTKTKLGKSCKSVQAFVDAHSIPEGLFG